MGKTLCSFYKNYFEWLLKPRLIISFYYLLVLLFFTVSGLNQF